MSIRIRLVVMCLVVALLPAAPLTFLVKTLFDKSFAVGLNPTVEAALQSGLSVSREHMENLRREFNLNVQRVADAVGDTPPDSAVVAAALARVLANAPGAIDGFVIGGAGTRDASGHGEQGPGGNDLPPDLRPFADNPDLRRLLENTSVVVPEGGVRTGYTFYETADRSARLAVWNPDDARSLSHRIRSGAPARGDAAVVLFFEEIDPEFLGHAHRMLEGRQKFAELRLVRQSLTRSFFYPFIIIYAICLALALGLALFMAERLAEPIRRLVHGAGAVAAGDWRFRIETKAGGETGLLVRAFNDMVSRLDSQRRRLIDMEKMATWREMARHLAHEIKNPLLPIRLTVEELKDQYTGDDTRYREILDESTRVVGDEVSNLQKLVKEFSTFAKMPDMNPRTGRLGQLVQDVARMYPGVAAQVELSADVPEFAFDPDQLRRVLVNLFENAVSVTPEGLTCRVRVRLDLDGGDVLLKFSDNGPGIPPEHLGRVFEPYFTTRAEGTGLGLAMTKQIILLHGGSIEAGNAKGGGALFEIRLPLEPKE